MSKFFSAMNESFTAGGKEWLEKCLSWKQRYPVCLPEYAQTKNGINLYYFVDRLSKFLKDDSVVVADAGSAMYAPAQGLKLPKTAEIFNFRGRRGDGLYHTGKRRGKHGPAIKRSYSHNRRRFVSV